MNQWWWRPQYNKLSLPHSQASPRPTVQPVIGQRRARPQLEKTQNRRLPCKGCSNFPLRTQTLRGRSQSFDIKASNNQLNISEFFRPPEIICWGTWEVHRLRTKFFSASLSALSSLYLQARSNIFSTKQCFPVSLFYHCKISIQYDCPYDKRESQLSLTIPSLWKITIIQV